MQTDNWDEMPASTRVFVGSPAFCYVLFTRDQTLSTRTTVSLPREQHMQAAAAAAAAAAAPPTWSKMKAEKK